MLKNLIKRIVYPETYKNEAYVKHLRSGGAKIGDGTYFYDCHHRPVDETSLPFVEIGRNCRITSGVVILAHDYSYAVLRPIYHEMLFKSSITIIGDNVFLGINSIIMPNCKIGNNVIVGAGSVVTGEIPSNVVVAGNPAKVVMTLDEYYDKNKRMFMQYAKTFFDKKKENMGRTPREDEMAWYAVLWKSDNREDIFKKLKVDGDNKEEVINDVMKISPVFDSYEDFINAIKKI